MSESSKIAFHFIQHALTLRRNVTGLSQTWSRGHIPFIQTNTSTSYKHSPLPYVQSLCASFSCVMERLFYYTVHELIILKKIFNCSRMSDNRVKVLALLCFTLFFFSRGHLEFWLILLFHYYLHFSGSFLTSSNPCQILLISVEAQQKANPMWFLCVFPTPKMS